MPGILGEGKLRFVYKGSLHGDGFLAGKVVCLLDCTLLRKRGDVAQASYKQAGLIQPDSESVLCNIYIRI